MECPICMEPSILFAVPSCHGSHSVCLQCSRMMKKCPFCRAKSSSDFIREVSSPEDECNLLIVKRGRCSSVLHSIVSKYAIDLGMIPQCSKDKVVGIDPIKTIVELECGLTMNILQYVIMMDEEVKTTGYLEGDAIMTICYNSLIYGLENDIDRIDELYHDPDIQSSSREEIRLKEEHKEEMYWLRTAIGQFIKTNMRHGRTLEEILCRCNRHDSEIVQEQIDVLIRGEMVYLVGDRYIHYHYYE